MKIVIIALLLVWGTSCFASETNVLIATDWSAPVQSHDHSIRARLLVTKGNEPAYGGPKSDNLTMMFVELQNMAGACCGSDKVYFDVMGLKLDLVDVNGKAVEPKMVSWDGRGPFSPSWIVLPYNSTIRLYANSGSKSPLTVCNGGEPWSYWTLPSNNTNIYYLSGTLTISSPTNAALIATPHREPNIHEYAEWSGTLVFPKTRISPSEITTRN